MGSCGWLGWLCGVGRRSLTCYLCLGNTSTLDLNPSIISLSVRGGEPGGLELWAAQVRNIYCYIPIHWKEIPQYVSKKCCNTLLMNIALYWKEMMQDIVKKLHWQNILLRNIVLYWKEIFHRANICETHFEPKRSIPLKNYVIL